MPPDNRLALPCIGYTDRGDGMPETSIDWLFPDGHGGSPLKKHGIVKIPGVLPGDIVEYREVSRRGSTVFGEVVRVITSSPDRIVPSCAHDEQCGGCDLSSLHDSARARSLARIAQQAFRTPEIPAWESHPSAGRARIKLQVSDGKLGYFAEKSHDLAEITDCEAARPEIRAAFQRLSGWASPERLAGWDSVEIRSNGERVVYSVQGKSSVGDLSDLGDVAVNGKAVHGDPTLLLSAGELSLRCSPLAFYQVNLEVNAVLLSTVRERIRAFQPERLLELYCGIGNFTLPLAKDGWKIHAVEREGQSVADLRWSAAQHGLSVEVVPQAAEKFDTSRTAFDVVLLDPPRSGAPGVVEKLLLNRPKALVYVSCDAPSAARDLQAAWKAGYRLQEVMCFDMFPKTRHFETLIVATR